MSMAGRGKEILEELRLVVSGKTLDALLPPLVFAVTNGFWGLNRAVLTALTLSLLLGLRRLLLGQKATYALGGFLVVGAASGLALFTRNASNYFISAALTSGSLLAAAGFSLLLGKPLAAWVSHLSRGWPLDWFWRADVKPAYREVTWFWAAFFAMRLGVQVILLRSGDTLRLAWANTLLGWPVTGLVLIISYLYGIWRLHQLGGPGVDEYRKGIQPPWRGQVRGF
jgi:hypothetical protein